MSLNARHSWLNVFLNNRSAFAGCVISMLTILVVVVWMSTRANVNVRRAGAVRFWLGHFKSYYLNTKLPSTNVLSKDGTQLSSWRFKEWALTTARNPQEALREAWNSPENASWRAQRPNVFNCKSNGHTAVCVVEGAGTAFDESSELTFEKLPPNTIVLIEFFGNHTHWMQPGDFSVNQLDTQPDSKSALLGDEKYQDGFFVGFADGEVWLLAFSTPLSKLKQLAIVETAKVYTRDTILAPHRIK